MTAEKLHDAAISAGFGPGIAGVGGGDGGGEGMEGGGGDGDGDGDGLALQGDQEWLGYLSRLSRYFADLISLTGTFLCNRDHVFVG